jgi:hypothetical protein
MFAIKEEHLLKKIEFLETSNGIKTIHGDH